MARTFEISTAVRHNTPILIGLPGPSGSGKTRSALRIATGIVKVQGGKIGLIDTEANRALIYAPAKSEKADPSKGSFDFEHIPFAAPFSPSDYLEALRFAQSKGCTTIIVDSMSHEHEGPGGVLEMHEAECDRLVAAWKNATRDSVKMSAWQKPKAQRRALINGFLQMQCNFIFCFRAKEKMYIPAPGERDDEGRKMKPEKKGYMPIGGEELVFEMTVRPLLLPNANGVPCWTPDEWGEREVVKMVDKLKHCFPDGEQLSEKTGEALAQWAAGGNGPELGSPDEIKRASLRDLLTKTLRMKRAEAMEWVKRYFEVTSTDSLSGDVLDAAIKLAKVRADNDDDAHEAVYNDLKAKGLVK